MASSFFEKLKKGMNIDEIIMDDEVLTEKETSEKVNLEPEKKQRKISPQEEKKPRKFKAKKTTKIKEEKLPQFEVETLITETNTSLVTATLEEKFENEKEWPSLIKDEGEGELGVDVFQTDNELVIQSAIAGVKIEDLEISIEREVIIIRGKREREIKENQDYFIKECFWGPFSREIIAPVEIDPGKTQASFNNGILTIKIPKIQREKKIKISLVE